MHQPHTFSVHQIWCQSFFLRFFHSIFVVVYLLVFALFRYLIISLFVYVIVNIYLIVQLIFNIIYCFFSTRFQNNFKSDSATNYTEHILSTLLWWKLCKNICGCVHWMDLFATHMYAIITKLSDQYLVFFVVVAFYFQ